MGKPERHVAFEGELFRSDGMRVAIRVVAARLEHFLIHEHEWRPRLRMVQALDAEWEWQVDFIDEELPADDRETYALLTDDGLEGLMSVVLAPGDLYVERLAVAPQNRQSGGRVLRGVGSVLLVHAARRSMQTGRAGRISLHSLEDPATVAFYAKTIGMLEVGTDWVDGQMMRRFVLDPVRAFALLQGKKEL